MSGVEDLSSVRQRSIIRRCHCLQNVDVNTEIENLKNAVVKVCIMSLLRYITYNYESADQFTLVAESRPASLLRLRCWSVFGKQFWNHGYGVIRI